jgi:hypothetical protein
LAIKSAFASTGIGLVLVGLGLLIEKIMTLRMKMDQVRQSAQEAALAIQFMSGAEAKATQSQAESDVKVLRNLRERTQGKSAATKTKVTPAEQAALERAGQMAQKFTSKRDAGGAIETSLGASNQQVSDALGQAQTNRTLASNRVLETVAEEASTKAEMEKLMEEVKLASSGDGSAGGSGAEGPTDITGDQLVVIEAINQKRREGNQAALIHLEFARELLDIHNSDLGVNDKAGKLDSARTKHSEALKKLDKEKAEESKKALEIEQKTREDLNLILRDAQLASGAISQEAYDAAMFERDRESTLRRIKKMEEDGAPPELVARTRAAVEAGEPPSDDKSFGAGIDSWIEKTEEELTNFKAMAESAADGIASEFGTAFSGILQGTMSLQEGLGQAFTNIGAMFADMVAQMLVKWAMVQIFKSVFPGFADGGVVNASGGGGAPKFGPGFANGGLVTGPTMAMVGEGRFNEAIVPLPNGKSIPVEMNGGAGGNIATNITVNVNNGQASSKSSGSQGNNLARSLEGAVKQVIMREMQPGGMINSKR